MSTSTVDTTAPQIAINDIGTEEDLLAAIDATIKHFNDGDIVEGHIVKVDRDEVLLDIGYKTEGVIPSRELSIKHDVDPNEVVAVGDAVEALVLQKEDKDGRLILSKKRAQYERAWGTIEKIKEEDGVVTGTVIEVVKGGLILDIGLRGFLPASLVEMRRVRDLQPYVGKEIEAKIIELDKNRNNVVLSRRAWLEQTQSEVRTTFLKELAKGQVRPADDTLLVGQDLVEVDALEDGVDADRRCMAGLVGDLRGVQQGLGGDAAAVQARPTQLVTLDEGDGQAELGSPQRARVAAAATAQDDQVVGVGGIGGGRHASPQGNRGCACILSSNVGGTGGECGGRSRGIRERLGTTRDRRSGGRGGPHEWHQRAHPGQ